MSLSPSLAEWPDRLSTILTTHQPGLFIEMGGERLRAPESALDSGCYT
jgi:hypothetical protein